ncbi:MAG: hypothetical protein KDK50_02155 [Chlamydiia bacterium]|nr:hypothetical protein [Chlamydiia bacterium]MCP5492002.1 hypothetical protein [Chlamydiales bacterium]
MKFQNFSAFGKHLREAFPHNLSQCFALIVPKADERESAACHLISVLQKADPKLKVYKTLDFDKTLLEIQENSLFGDLPLVYLDEVESLNKKQWQELILAIKSLPSGVRLILAGANAKACPTLSTEVKDALVMLDLSAEKPWDREKRIAEQLMQRASENGKTMERACLDYLFQAIGPELGLLEQALEKLICYSGEASHIDLKAAHKLVRPSKEQSLWQVAEKLIWDKVLPRRVESNDFPMLIGALRYQLELGLCMTLTPEQLKERFPTLRDRSLSKFQNYRYPAQYFERALRALYTSERAFKNGVSDGSLCFDLFAGKLLA